MKKILFFIESLSGGGAEKVLSDIVSNLDRDKYDITVCTVTDEGVYQEQVSKVCKYRSLLKMKNYRAGGFRKVLFWLKLKAIYSLPVMVIYRFFFREKYDIEVAFVEGFVTKIIAASTNVSSRKLAWVHVDMIQNQYADSNFKNEISHSGTYKKYDKIVCVSQSVKKAFEEKFFKSNNICVQYNPVDEKKIFLKSKEKISIDSIHPLLGTIGRLEEVKGYFRLVQCAKKLCEEGYKFEIWIIGQGSQKEKIEKYIVDNQLSNCVKLLGFQKNPYKYIAQCDAFICSSYAEGFSTAATESLIIGKPIFTVECAGMRELFGEERCGEIVENSDKALYFMMKNIVSGKVELSKYQEQVVKRSNTFQIANRIQEIECLLSTVE